jgi:hypothetical protein
MTTPRTCDIASKAALLHAAWSAAGRDGSPQIHLLIVSRPSPDDFALWADAGVTDLVWGVPDADEATVVGHLDKVASRLP